MDDKSLFRIQLSFITETGFDCGGVTENSGRRLDIGSQSAESPIK